MSPTFPHAAWLSTPNVWLLELLHAKGVRKIILDIEHGIFNLRDTDTYILLAKSMGFEVHAKVLAPEMSPIQQMLDMGADSVIIPHIENLEHAREVCSYAKFPPSGKRSYAGGRTVTYGAASSEYFPAQNKKTKCYPMIETSGALEDIASILALETVDGIFVGPSDLSLSCGRGHYQFTNEDRTDLLRIIRAADAAGKPWIMPAWRESEQQFSNQNNVGFMATLEEQEILAAGLNACISASL